MALLVSVNKKVLSSMMATIINMLAPVIIIPILIGKLGLDYYGIYVTSLAFVALCLVLGEFGFTMVIPKVIAKSKDDNKAVNDILSIFLTTKTLYFLVVFILLCCLEINTGVDYKYILVLFALQLFSLEPLLNGMQKFHVTMAANLLNKSLLLTGVSFIDFNETNLSSLILYQSLCFLISQCYIFYQLTFKIGFKFKYYFKAVFVRKDMVIDCVEFYFSKVFVNIYQQASTYFVSIFCISSHVAIYSIALQLYKLGQSLIGAVGQVLYTTTLRSKNLSSIIKFTKLTVTCYLFGGLVIIFSGELILGLLFKEDAELLFEISSVLYGSLLFVIFSSYFGYPSLSPIGKDRFSHAGIFLSAATYFSGFIYSMLFLQFNLYIFVLLILFADFTGAALRVFFSYKFWGRL